MATNANISKLPPLDPSHVAIVEKFGAKITPLDPIGAQIEGIDLSSSDAPEPELRDTLEHEMAIRGFLVFKNEKQLEPDGFVRASCW